MQAASLLGLAACMTSTPTSPSWPSKEAEDRQVFARLVLEPPSGCAVGSSGPTRNPRDSIRYARMAAVEALAAESLEVDVQTISGDGPNGAFEIASQALSGTLANGRIFALWADVDDSGRNRRRVRQVFAMACWADASAPDLPESGYPDWLIEPPRDAATICAAGIAGPTRKRSEQAASALRDARLALAVALESRIEKRIFDDGHGVAKMARQIDPSPAALARAATAEDLEEEWYDESGRGPVGLPGVLYGLACIEN